MRMKMLRRVEIGNRLRLRSEIIGASLCGGILVSFIAFGFMGCDASTDPTEGTALPEAADASGAQGAGEGDALASDSVVSEADAFEHDPGRIPIPGGEFVVGCTEKDPSVCMPDELPSEKRTVEPFSIDRTEVTVANYGACVEAGVCSPAGREEQGCNVALPNRNHHPINCVDWDQAMVYCAWRGGRLPTEWEWERVARGASGRRNPWGDEPADCRRAVFGEGKGRACGEGDTTFEVGSKPEGATPEGVVDLIGNVWEWTASTRPNSTARVLRGGAYSIEPKQARASLLLRFEPTGRAPFVGFRCAE